jgi:phenylalanyl-tRNA synthetase alpha chain
VNTIQDVTREQLLEVQKLGTHPTALADLSKRKLIERKKLYYFSVKKGDEFTFDIKRQETDINVEMMQRLFSFVARF